MIETQAHTGLRGDEKIYVSMLDQAARISTGERGDPAVCKESLPCDQIQET